MAERVAELNRPAAARTILETLARHAADQPDALFVFTPGDDAAALTYGETWRAAWGWRDRLAALGIGRDWVIHIGLPNGPAFVAAFFGTILLGAVAAPMPPRRGQPASDYAALIRERALDGRAAGVIAAAEDLVGLDLPEWRLVADGGAADGLDAGLVPDPGDWRDGADAEAVAVMQFTSGTSGRPKAVALSHRALLHQMRAIAEAIALDPSVDHAISWLPLFHDMGLIGFLLTPLFIGGRVGLMPTERFMKSPWSWIEAMARYRATITAAPPSAWLLASRFASPQRLAGVSLAPMRVAMIGAECIAPEVVARVIKCFAPAGLAPQSLAPAYGMAEVGLAVTIAPVGRGVRTAEIDGQVLVSCGTTVPGTRLRIVAADGRDQPLDAPGTVLVRSDSVMSGYAGDPVRTESVLRGDWYDTRDRGIIVDDQLYIFGREDDQIVIGGRNYTPEAFEELMDEVPGLRDARTAAIALDDSATGTQRAVLVVEHRRGDAREIKRLIRAAAARRQLPLGPIVFVAPGTIRYTRNGKLPRAHLRDHFATHGIDDEAL